MGFNTGKVILVSLALIVAGLIYFLTQKEMIEAVSFWIGEALNQKKIEVSKEAFEVKSDEPQVRYIEKPNLKAHARFKFRYQLYAKDDLVTHAEEVTWRILSLDSEQMTWEGDNGWLEAYSRNPFLPPLKATVSAYRPTERVDYLSAYEVFPLSSGEPKVVRIQDRTLADSRAYEWSCLITGADVVPFRDREYPVEIVTCIARGGQNGTETFKFSQSLGHWIHRERRGFGQPKLVVELLDYLD